METPSVGSLATRDSPILECRGLSVSYAGRRGDIPAVVDFNLTLSRGEAHGPVGVSGCGKSTVALAIMRHLGLAGRVVAGPILFQARDLLTMDAEELRRIRGDATCI
jgi:peptide/nickel transport system ATP-binding protein